jgi:hypothetical protein
MTRFCAIAITCRRAGQLMHPGAMFGAEHDAATYVAQGAAARRVLAAAVPTRPQQGSRPGCGSACPT